MAPMTTALLSADEYLSTPDARPQRTELINGEVHMNTPALRHQRLVRKLLTALDRWCASDVGLGEVFPTLDLRVDATTVLAPDGVWMSDPPTDAVALTEAPPLVFEVRSPSTWQYDTGIKLQKYQTFGVQEVWLIDTESHSILVHRRSDPNAPTFDIANEVFRNETLTSPLLPGFVLPIDSMFAD
jgi:Uma2 family endonuclease